MADVLRRLAKNATGDFFVDETCINCGACRNFAPKSFSEAGSYSYVSHQPQTNEDLTSAIQAVLACPVGAIGAGSQKISKDILDSFPIKITNDIYINGFNSEKSYGADSYFIRSAKGNWLVDSPRFTPLLASKFEEMGGLKYIFLSHRDDVADAEQYAKKFHAQRIIHKADVSAQPRIGGSICPAYS